MNKVPTIAQCFSALIASGNGQRCNEFKHMIHQQFLAVDEETGEHKSLIFKYGYEKYPEVHRKLRQEMGGIISSLVGGMDLRFFGNDLGEENVQRKQ